MMDRTDPFFIAGYIASHWGRRAGDPQTLADWVGVAKETFPDVDLLAESRKAAMWEADRPSRQKKIVRRFLTNWWGRAQQSADKSSAPVVCLDSVRWLKVNNRVPEKKLSNWLRGRGPLTEEKVREFCKYYECALPSSIDEVLKLYSPEQRRG